MLLNRIPFECLKLFVHFVQRRKDTILPDSIVGNKTLIYRFNLVYLKFTPTSNFTGNVTVLGDREIGQVYYSDLVKLNNNFRPLNNFYRIFVAKRETIDYSFLKLLYDIEYNHPRVVAPTLP